MLRDMSKYSPRPRAAGWAAVLLAAFAITPLTFVARSQDRDQPAQTALSTRPIASRVIAAAPSQAASTSAAERKGQDKRLNYVLFLDDKNTMMSGSSADTDRAESLRKGQDRMMWFRRDGREYVVRDPALLREVEEIYRPLRETGGEQAKIGSKQAEIGRRQAEIGKQQAAIGRKQAEIGARQARIGFRQAASRQEGKEKADTQELAREPEQLELEMEQFEREMKELSSQMAEFNSPMGELSEEMNSLSKEMDVLSRKMEEVSAKAEVEMSKLLDRAISSGAATEVK